MLDQLHGSELIARGTTGRAVISAHEAAHAIGFSSVVVGGAALVALATLAGATLARSWPAHREAVFGAAAGVLLAVALGDLLPSAWSEAVEQGVPALVVAMTTFAAFVAAALLGRVGCSCASDRQRASGTGTALALMVHRFLEGSVLALVGSATVAVALGVHALGEGLAVGILVADDPRHRRLWPVLLAVSPIAGIVASRAVSLTSASEPVLLAAAGGVLLQAARISWGVALGPTGARLPRWQPFAAALVTGGVTLVAVIQA